MKSKIAAIIIAALLLSAALPAVAQDCHCETPGPEPAPPTVSYLPLVMQGYTLDIGEPPLPPPFKEQSWPTP